MIAPFIYLLCYIKKSMYYLGKKRTLQLQVLSDSQLALKTKAKYVHLIVLDIVYSEASSFSPCAI